MQHLQDSFDGYSVMTTWQKTGEGYIAYLMEFPGVSAYGDEPQLAVEELSKVWQVVKSTYTEKGDKVPVAPSRQDVFPENCDGNIEGLEIDPQLHLVLTREALRDNVPLSSLIGRKLKVLADWTLLDN